MKMVNEKEENLIYLPELPLLHNSFLFSIYY